MEVSEPTTGSVVPSETTPILATGRFIATVLSAYDLPNDSQPSNVSLEALGMDVRTGPPLAKHRDTNSFRFASNNNEGASKNASTNELVVEAPLPDLFHATVRFRVSYTDASNKVTQDLVADCKLDSTLRINETQWLILNLSPEAGSRVGAKPSTSSAITNTTSGTPPTLRVKLLLVGPFRPEVAAIIAIANHWFRLVDGLADATRSTVTSLTVELPSRVPQIKYLLIPAVPVAAGVVALLPVFIGVLIIGLPFFLPLLIVVAAFGGALVVMGGTVYFSTESGRKQIAGMATPVISTFVGTSAGQSIVYETGPRPSPVSITRAITPEDMVGKLVVSLVVDFIGSSSYLLPGIGEAFDVAWAPTQTVIVAAMYDDVSPSLKYISFVEEIMPFTDLIPTATMGWVREFGPEFFHQGQRRMHDLAVAARGEAGALQRASNRRAKNQ